CFFTDNSLLIIFFFMLLMVSMSMVTTPFQTKWNNQLESDLYPYGKAVVNSIIQTSGAIGTALAMSILNVSQRAYLGDLASPGSATHQAEALIAGVQNAFSFAIIVSIAGFICSLFLIWILVG